MVLSGYMAVTDPTEGIVLLLFVNSKHSACGSNPLYLSSRTIYGSIPYIGAIANLPLSVNAPQEYTSNG